MEGLVVANAKKFFGDAITNSNCCTFTEDSDAAAIMVEGKIYDDTISQTSAALVGFISGVTFTVIPGWVTEKTHISANVKFNQKTYKYELSDSATLIIWFPLVLATPFQRPYTIMGDVNKNVYKNLVLEMKKDGLLGAQ